MSEEQNVNEDVAFLLKIIYEIKDYAEKNGMSADETIRQVADNMLDLLKVASFDNDKTVALQIKDRKNGGERNADGN